MQAVGSEGRGVQVTTHEKKEYDCDMTEAERSKYDGRDMVILNRHTEDTIQEDKLSFPMQMENHLPTSACFGSRAY